MKFLSKVLLVVALVLSFSSIHAGAADVSKLMLKGDLTLEQAQRVTQGALAKAQEQGTLMNIAIVDAGGNLKSFVRMDGAFLASVDIAMRKARTARSLNMSTLELSKLAAPGAPLYGIEVLDGSMAIFGGGELLLDGNGVIIGAIGVSGSSVENDVAVAKAGAAALLKTKLNKTN
ncbi:GlcG/HbpS family heme-binding protein [Oleidesulfovibrio sp.]|uniref:GlcG/HbpS family heme-binding protein n=1 Tax=Oleidesulfovibrio sp. TaxID=2909707 RepID=UPI003A87D5B7